MIMSTVLSVGAHLLPLLFIISWRSTCAKQLKLTNIYWYVIPLHAHVLISMSLCIGAQLVLFRQFAENPLMSIQATLDTLSCRYMLPYACLIALAPFLLLLSAFKKPQKIQFFCFYFCLLLEKNHSTQQNEKHNFKFDHF